MPAHLGLKCPDSSVTTLDNSIVVIGRGSVVGGIHDNFVSRQQLAVSLVEDTQAGHLVKLENLGLNPVVVEHEDRTVPSPAQPGGWHATAVLQKGQTARIGIGHRFYVATRMATTMFEVIAGSPTAAAAASTPAAALRPQSSEPCMAEPEDDATEPAPMTVGRSTAFEQSDDEVQIVEPPSKRQRTASSDAAISPNRAHAATAAAVTPAIEDAKGKGPHSVTDQMAEYVAMQQARHRASNQAGTSSMASSSQQDIPPPLALLRVRDPSMPTWANSGMLAARMSEVVRGDMKWILISNFMIDLPWFLSACPDVSKAGQVVIAHGERRMAGWMHDSVRRQLPASTIVHAPRLPEPYGTHHSKAFVIEYATGLRVVVHTANLISPDCNSKSQGVWVQDFPRKDEAAQAAGPSEFEDSLADYLQALELPEPAGAHAQELCASHDFCSARAQLIPSIPGKHNGPKLHRYGHMRVRDLLGQERFDAAFRHAPMLAQCSSLGSLDEKWLLNEFRTSLAGGSCGEGQKLGLPASGARGFQFVWPMVAEVRDSVEGWYAGGSIPGPLRNTQKPFLQQYWHRWGGEPAGRQHAMPHIKTYARYLADGADRRLAWFLLASHNLSKAAWGTLTNGIQGRFLHLRSYELGVLLLPSLEARYRRHPHCGFSATPGLPPLPSQPLGEAAGAPVAFFALESADTAAATAGDGCQPVILPVPYKLPPTHYRPGDVPWNVTENFPGLDSHGHTMREAHDDPSLAHYGNIEAPE